MAERALGLDGPSSGELQPVRAKATVDDLLAGHEGLPLVKGISPNIIDAKQCVGCAVFEDVLHFLGRMYPDAVQVGDDVVWMDMGFVKWCGFENAGNSY